MDPFRHDVCTCSATQADASDGSISGCAALFVCRNSWVRYTYTSRNAPMILTVTPSREGHPAHHFLWSKDQGSTTPSSYGKTFKMFEPHTWPRLTYQFETYSTSVMIITNYKEVIFHKMVFESRNFGPSASNSACGSTKNMSRWASCDLQFAFPSREYDPENMLFGAISAPLRASKF